MSRDYWLTCDLCRHEWIGEPYRTDGYDEKCPECNSEEFEIGAEYGTPTLARLRKWLAIILLVLNAILGFNDCSLPAQSGQPYLLSRAPSSEGASFTHKLPTV